MNNGQNTLDSKHAGNITQTYNLSFEIGKINNYGDSSDGNFHSNDKHESSARASSGNQNGKSTDRGHGENQESRSGYSRSNTRFQGKPVGKSLLNNECLDGIQEIKTSDLSPGDDAVRQPVKLSGKSIDKGHSTRKSQLADPTTGLSIHPQVVQYCDPKEIDNQEKISQMLTVSYPEGHQAFDCISRTEKIAISILRTCVVPSNIIKRERDQFDKWINHINRYRRENGIPSLPKKLLNVKLQALLPCLSLVTCSDNNRTEYCERLRLINLEVEMLDWIETGIIPKMDVEEKAQMERDLESINELRMEEDGVFLDLSKTVDEHFVHEIEEKSPSRKRNSDFVDLSMEEIDDITDEDDEIFSSDSDSDSNNGPTKNIPRPPEDSARTENKPRLSEAERLELLRRNIEFFSTLDSKPSQRPISRANVPPDSQPSVNHDSKSSGSDDVITKKGSKEGGEQSDCFIGKNLKLFLKQLDYMTKCPISQERFKVPCIGSDNIVYERVTIMQWLQQKNTSPLTRNYMRSESLKNDYTMQRIVQSFNDFKIDDHVLSHLKCAPKDTSSKVPKDDNFVLPKQRLSKKARLGRNQEAKSVVKQKLKIHRNYLKSMNFYLPCNLLSSMPATPSFSIMHSLREGFSIHMYSGSHRVNIHEWLQMHHPNAIEIILPPWMMIIWHEALFHAGAKSRGTQEGTQEDLRFFSYVWPKVKYPDGSRMTQRTDGVLRESGDRVYREDINQKICKDMYSSRPTCQYCRMPSQVLDLRDIPPNSYCPGDRITGDLDEYGWMVVRGVRMNENMYEAMDMVKSFGRKSKAVKVPQWYSIEDRNNNRVMKYNHISPIHDVWYSDPDLNMFIAQLQNEVIKKALSPDKRFPTYREKADYVIGKFNLLMNRGPISCAQQAHTDYKARIQT